MTSVEQLGNARHPDDFGIYPQLRAERILEIVGQMSHGATNKAISRALGFQHIHPWVANLTLIMFLAGQLRRHPGDTAPIRYYLP